MPALPPTTCLEEERYRGASQQTYRSSTSIQDRGLTSASLNLRFQPPSLGIVGAHKLERFDKGRCVAERVLRSEMSDAARILVDVVVRTGGRFVLVDLCLLLFDGCRRRSSGCGTEQIEVSEGSFRPTVASHLTLFGFSLALLGTSGGGSSGSGCCFLLSLFFRFTLRLVTLLLLLLLFLPLGLLRGFLFGRAVLRFSRQLDRLGRVVNPAVDLASRTETSTPDAGRHAETSPDAPRRRSWRRQRTGGDPASDPRSEPGCNR